uniref:Uncharacterized protein n=1 Tax=Rhizophora mucronata TaxID=61149 RepID=A0A2P2LMM1_RHIMU
MGNLGGTVASLCSKASWLQELGLDRHGSTGQKLSSPDPNHRRCLPAEVPRPQSQVLGYHHNHGSRGGREGRGGRRGGGEEKRRRKRERRSKRRRLIF